MFMYISLAWLYLSQTGHIGAFTLFIRTCRILLDVQKFNGTNIFPQDATAQSYTIICPQNEVISLGFPGVPQLG